jgi:SAM-dependent methyltransferase
MIATVAKYVYAMDYDPCAVHYGSINRAANVSWSVGDVANLPYQSAFADVVISFEVIEHVHDHRALLAEAARVLKTDGSLVLSTPNTATATLFRRTAGFTYDAHVSEVGLAALRNELTRYFADVKILGMRMRGNRVYEVLRAVDVFNLRLRILPSREIAFAREKLFGIPARGITTDNVVVSHRQLRQANHFLALCTSKRAGPSDR